MNDTKEKSAVGAATPATEKDINISSENIISSAVEKVKMIPIKKMVHHPDNPRKDIGDIAELTDSIRKNGIMQNLTVIPKDGCYWVLIGNRRFEAAKNAGLSELPCKVVDGLTPSEQLGIMLEENMQRNDLTVIEQAQGFQLMLDMGETIESIAKRTGFSQKTVKQRVGIAQLDQKILKKKNEEFQLSITDLVRLEQISDPVERDKILDGAVSPESLRSAIDRRIEYDREQQIKQMIINLMNAAGIPENSAGTSLLWNGNWETLAQFDFCDATKDKVRNNYEPKIESIEVTPDIVYILGARTVYVLKPRKKQETSKALTEAEKKQRQINENRAKVNEAVKGIVHEMDIFVLQRMHEIGHNIGSIIIYDRELRWIWDIMAEIGVSPDRDDLVEVFLSEDIENSSENEIRSANYKLRKVPVGLQMLYVIVRELEYEGLPMDYAGFYDEDAAKPFNSVHSILDGYGFRFNEEKEEFFKSVLDGTSELYMKEETENA